MVDATRGYAVDPNGGERLTFGGGTVLIKAATPAVTVWEEQTPLLDTPLHVHEREDELLHIGFFRMLADAERAGTLGPDTCAGASARYGITWLP